MNRQEAARIADEVIGELEGVPYDTLVTRLLDAVETREVIGPSGVEYQVEIQAMWDSGRPGDLRVLVGVDDGSFRGAFAPVSGDFVIAGDGSLPGRS